MRACPPPVTGHLPKCAARDTNCPMMDRHAVTALSETPGQIGSYHLPGRLYTMG